MRPAGLSSRSGLMPAVLAFQLGLLTVGIGNDYRLKHEDNNALHATFARSHLQLGFKTTKGQNYFYSPASGTGTFYTNHPPGPGLVLALVYRITGHDGPFVTRAAAIAFHLAATLLFFGLARRIFRRPREALLATGIFILLPESAFFGRMMNHEVLVLPAAILLVRGYWELVWGDDRPVRWYVACVLSSVWAALAGWAGFFAIGACAVHAGWTALFRLNGRARVPFLLLAGLGALLLLADLAHLTWVGEGGLAALRDLLWSRMGSTAEYGAGQWTGRVLELHWRYFSATGMIALGALAIRGIRDVRPPAASDAAVAVGMIFLIAGVAYVAVFNFSAMQHDYWQFLLLPSSAIAMTLAFRWLVSNPEDGKSRMARTVLLTLAVIEITATVGVTLTQRHVKSEAYCVETVETLRRDML